MTEDAVAALAEEMHEAWQDDCQDGTDDKRRHVEVLAEALKTAFDRQGWYVLSHVDRHRDEAAKSVAPLILAALPEGWHLTHSDAAEVERLLLRLDVMRMQGSGDFAEGFNLALDNVRRYIQDAALSSTEAVK